MEIYLLRHGDAAEPGMRGIRSDAERPLTEDGISDLKRSALGMKRMGLVFDRVVSSPYVRALETARIVLKVLGHPGEIELNDALCPDALPADILKTASKFGRKERILLVGHQPSISGILSRLIGGASGASAEFKKGALACIGVDDGQTELSGGLKWFLTQEHLGAIVQ